MKIFITIIGGILSGFLCFVIFSLISKYQINKIGYIHSDSDKLIDLFVIITPLVILIGGWLSLRFYKKSLTKGSSGRKNRAA